MTTGRINQVAFTYPRQDYQTSVSIKQPPHRNPKRSGREPVISSGFNAEALRLNPTIQQFCPFCKPMLFYQHWPTLLRPLADHSPTRPRHATT